MKPSLFYMLTVSILGLIGCEKDNQQSGVNFNLSTNGRSATTGRPEGTTGTINWTSGFASATEIEFEAENANTEVEYKSAATQRIDLFAPISSLGFVAIPPGTYEEVEFEIHLAPTSNTPSLELRGLYNATAIVFRINTPLEIEAEYEDVTITSSNDFTANISLNLALLTQGITDVALGSATLTNGEIIISSSSNPVLYNIMIQNLSRMDSVEFDD